MSNKNLEFMLRNCLRVVRWNPDTGRLVLSFNQGIRTIFCGLCCFVDRNGPDGEIKPGEQPRWIKDLLADTSRDRELTLDLGAAKDGQSPRALLVFLPEFWEDASAGKVRETYRVSCFEIPLET